jgi:hypothetical protein
MLRLNIPTEAHPRRGSMYGKTFTALWEGSMVGQSDPQLVFIFLFCHCDRSGFVEAHPAIVSVKTGLSIERVEAALSYLEATDPRSRSKAEGGKRIIRLDGDHSAGWKVVNYEYYRGLRRAEDRREYQRQYWHTRKLKSTQPPSTPLNPTLPIADAEADVDAKTKDLRALESPGEDDLTSEQAFEEVFWPLYPRKRHKATARKAWKALKLKDDDDETLEAIMVALRNDVSQEWKRRDPDKIPHPATWLNSKPWEDGR